MTKMTIEIPEKEYKKLKITVATLGTTIKDYVLDALHLKETILIREDGVVRVLKPDTIKALKASRDPKKLKKFKSFDNVEEAIKHLNDEIKK